MSLKDLTELSPSQEYPRSLQGMDILAEKSRPDEETIIAVGGVLSLAAFFYEAEGAALSA